MNYVLIAVASILVFIGIMFLRKMGSAVSAAREPVVDSEGQEVFSGEADEAAKVVHTLADAGVMGWIETSNDGKHRVLVEETQQQDVPALLAVQAQISQEQAAEEAKPAVATQA